MRTFYYRVTTNFGDHMNAWLWPQLLPGLIEEQSPDTLVGIGSLIKSDMSRVPGRKIIFGTGSGYGPMPLPQEIADWRIYFVRGPLTARLLDLPPEKAIVDAAWLVDELPALKHRDQPRSGTVFVPHWTTDVYANWRQPCADAGIDYISPFLPGEEVLARIAGAKLAICESLHGAIMADYYRVPWIPVATDGRVLAFKWLDFCQSVGLPYRPIRLPGTDWIERLVNGGEKPWSGGLEYLPEAKADDFQKVPFAAQKPDSAAYRARIRVKSAARSLRSRALTGLATMRSTAAFRRQFDAKSKRLAGLLDAVTREPALLSSDAIRDEKLAALRTQLHALRRDFGNGAAPRP